MFYFVNTKFNNKVEFNFIFCCSMIFDDSEFNEAEFKNFVHSK